jgi:hypothetical protein
MGWGSEFTTAHFIPSVLQENLFYAFLSQKACWVPVPGEDPVLF